ncbi:elongation factor P hydroxylase [Halomonas sp. FME1]|uniref:Elongation factor P hydroxylase n=1 Tax=Halomonas casei TaxID=2742613 RepID=A0ABR9F5K5_9GAMM|nr:elongation factor P hydroxylase [Halomonas casei]MBE0401389.1 elongation factor P hydroxylase [Halomonas casei]
MSYAEERWTLEDITALFDGVFGQRYQTRLIRGDDEPLYRPANNETPYHQVIFARGYFASALHEISHWCIAGSQRRLQEDYGYWYCPDGRNAEQQALFERAEIVPQALESIFTHACGRPFNISVDNLGGDVEVDRSAFTARVVSRAQGYLKEGLPVRANAFLVAINCFYSHQKALADAIAEGQAVLDQLDVTASA